MPWCDFSVVSGTREDATRRRAIIASDPCLARIAAEETKRSGQNEFGFAASQTAIIPAASRTDL